MMNKKSKFYITKKSWLCSWVTSKCWLRNKREVPLETASLQFQVGSLMSRGWWLKMLPRVSQDLMSCNSSMRIPQLPPCSPLTTGPKLNQKRTWLSSSTIWEAWTLKSWSHNTSYSMYLPRNRYLISTFWLKPLTACSVQKTWMSF